MDAAQLVVTILSSAGGSAVVVTLINGTIKWLSGASGRERQRNTDLATQRTRAIEERDAAEKERDEADLKRREAEEYAARLRVQLFTTGITPEDWPYDRTIPKAQIKKEVNSVKRKQSEARG